MSIYRLVNTLTVSGSVYFQRTLRTLRTKTTQWYLQEHNNKGMTSLIEPYCNETEVKKKGVPATQIKTLTKKPNNITIM